jgi:transcriptional regulator of arginine metabolism
MRMNDLKGQRQRAIANLIRTQAIASQEELGERLAGLGYSVTQATISRDLEQLGAIKVRRDGQLAYALPDDVTGAPGPKLAAVLRDWVRSIDTAANLVVIKTPPGTAHLVGVALDGSDLPQLVGTLCGDDTIFAACAGAAEAKALAAELRALTMAEVA